VSLLACEGAVAGRSFYKLDGDLLFDVEVLRRLDGCGGDIVLAVDRGASLGAEEMKVRLGGGFRVEAIGKGMDVLGGYQKSYGESIGIERINSRVVGQLFGGLRAAVGAGELGLYYEDVYGRLVDVGVDVRGVDVGDLGWMEVDTMEDLRRAESMGWGPVDEN